MSDSPIVSPLHAVFAEACLGATAEQLTDDLSGYLENRGLSSEDADAMVAAPRRLGLYRHLVRHNLIEVVALMLPRTRARLDALAPFAFNAAMDSFLAARGPRTPYLRDVPSEFLAEALVLWRAHPKVPSWLTDYAEFELVDFTVAVAPRSPVPTDLADVAADRALVFRAPHVLVHYAWAVHDVDVSDVTAVPAHRPVDILVYRDAQHRSRFLDLTPLAAAILERLFAGQPLSTSMVEACLSLSQPMDGSVVQGAARLLADLGERGVLLGAR